MSEKIPNNNESFEKNPNERIVFSKIEEILGSRDCQEIKKVEDEEGLYIWIFETLDESGDKLEIEYLRGRTLPISGKTTISRIVQTLYTSDGMPCGVGAQFDYVNQEWIEKN